MTESNRPNQLLYLSLCLLAAVLCSLTPASVAQSRPDTAQTSPLPKVPADVKPGSITFEDVPYPYPVSFLPLTLYGQDVRMAYMDIPPAGQPNGRTVVLLHGMN